MSGKYIYIESKDMKKAYRVDWNDLHDSFKYNIQLNSTYEISFTLTYTENYKDVFNVAKEKCGCYYNGDWFDIQQRENKIDENGFLTMQITAVNTVIDRMKNIRIDDRVPTEDNPDVSGDNTSDDSGDNTDPQPGVVTKRTDEQQTYTLDDRLHKFFDNNQQNLTYELHGDFPQAACDVTNTSLYEWLSNNLKYYGAYWIPHAYKIDFYDMDHLKNVTGKQFRYLNNMTEVDIQTDANDMCNDVWVYGGKMEKDITTELGAGGQSNGATEPINGDWTPVMQNAALLVGEKLSNDDIANIKNRIRIESGGNETAVNNWDSNAAAGHPSKGLLQFIDTTFNYYCRPPYTNINRGLDQLIAMMNIPDWRNQIAGNSGWSPHGAPISKDTITVKASSDSSWGWPFPSVGEGSFTGGQLFGVNAGGEFRTNGFHDGLDFGSIDHPGSEVHAIHGGTCTISRAWGSGGINWYCVITDSSGLNVEYQEAFGSAGNITVNVGQQVNTGDVIGYRTTNHLHVGITRASIPGAFSHAFSNGGTWIDPLATIKTGIANGGSGDDSGSTTSTTSETYYSLAYHFVDQKSIDTYGRYTCSAPLKVDSIYDMDALKKYADENIKHVPAVTLSISTNEAAKPGDVWRLIAPEMGINTDVTLLGFEGNDPDFNDEQNSTLTFDSTGLAMKDVNVAILDSIKDINSNIANLNTYGALGGRQEDHFSNLRFTPNQVKKMSEFKYSGGETNGGKGKSS